MAVAMVLCRFAQQFLLPHNKVGRYTLPSVTLLRLGKTNMFSLLSLDAMFSLSCRATALCLGCGTAGKSDLRTSKYNHTLPALAPSLFCPDTTAHQTCAGLRQMKHMRLNGFVQTALLGVCVIFLTNGYACIDPITMVNLNCIPFIRLLFCPCFRLVAVGGGDCLHVFRRGGL